jgi:hypothetical protein
MDNTIIAAFIGGFIALLGSIIVGYKKEILKFFSRLKKKLIGASEGEIVNITLTKEAIILLKKAAQKDVGIINKRVYLGGKNIQAGDLKIDDKSKRQWAKWENALNELKNKGLITDISNKGKIFEFTPQCWTLIDKL